MIKNVKSETQKFTSDIIWVAFSQVLSLLLSIITLPFLTKTYSTDLYGVWAQIGVTVGLLTPILILHLSTALIRFIAAEEDKNKRRNAFGAMLWPVLAFCGLALFISLLLRDNLSTLIFADTKYGFFIPLTFLWASMSALFSFSISYLRARGMIKKLSVISIILALAKMAAIVVLAMIGLELEWIVSLVIIAQAILVIFVFFSIIKEVGVPWPQFGGLKCYLAFSIPLIPLSILLWVINMSDRYLITHFLDISQTGIYSASYTLGSLIALFFGPISFVLFPTLSRLWEQKEQMKVKNYLEYSTKLFLTFAIPGAIGLWMLSQPLLRTFTTPEYAVGGALVLLIALGVLLLGLYQINVHIILLMHQTKWLPPMVGLATAVNIGLNIILIPAIGIIGAAISTIVSFFILAVIVFVWVRRAVKFRVDLKFMFKVAVATGLMAIFLFLMPVSSILSIVLAIIIGLLIYLLCLLVLKTFSRQDFKLIREALSGLSPKQLRKESMPKDISEST
jgi:O-antigen/teichoic acid export membrane protein